MSTLYQIFNFISTFFKKYNAKDIVVIKDSNVKDDGLDGENEEDLKEKFGGCLLRIQMRKPGSSGWRRSNGK